VARVGQCNQERSPLSGGSGSIVIGVEVKSQGDPEWNSSWDDDFHTKRENHVEPPHCCDGRATESPGNTKSPEISEGLEAGNQEFRIEYGEHQLLSGVHQIVTSLEEKFHPRVFPGPNRETTRPVEACGELHGHGLVFGSDGDVKMLEKNIERVGFQPSTVLETDFTTLQSEYEIPEYPFGGQKTP
jgi:hypothetical protein